MTQDSEPDIKRMNLRHATFFLMQIFNNFWALWKHWMLRWDLKEAVWHPGRELQAQGAAWKKLCVSVMRDSAGGERVRRNAWGNEAWLKTEDTELSGCVKKRQEDGWSYAGLCRRRKMNLKVLCYKPSHINFSFSRSIHKLSPDIWEPFSWRACCRELNITDRVACQEQQLLKRPEDSISLFQVCYWLWCLISSDRFFLWSVSFRKEMLNTVVPSVKGQALLLAHCAMEASFQCWQTDSESPTGLSDVRLVTKAVCSPARSVLPDQDHHLCSRLQAPQQYLVENFELFNPQAASLRWQVFKRWERHVIHLSP